MESNYSEKLIFLLEEQNQLLKEKNKTLEQIRKELEFIRGAIP